MLALSNDTVLKGPAVRELKAVSSPTEMLQLADQWAEASEKKEGPVQRALLARAIHWHEQARPRLSGLARAQADKRIEELRRKMIPSGKDVVNIHLVATIDGSDSIEISASHAKWTHHGWDWPQSVAINGVRWSPRRVPVLPFAKAFGSALPRIDFNSAQLETIRGRGRVRLEKSTGRAAIHISDGQGGADAYELVVTFRRLTR
jgi:hypothetical protein